MAGGFSLGMSGPGPGLERRHVEESWFGVFVIHPGFSSPVLCRSGERDGVLLRPLVRRRAARQSRDLTDAARARLTAHGRGGTSLEHGVPVVRVAAKGGDCRS